MTTAPTQESTAGGGTRVGPVSAVVCNYNGAEYLPACLDALLALSSAPDEILVVDNASTDGSRELLEERYPDVRVLALEENGGPVVARNAGLRAARHRWVLAVDNDAVLRPDVLERLRRALDEDPRAVIAQPRSVHHDDPATVHYDGGHFHYAGLFALRNFHRPLDQAEGRGVVAVDGFVSICGLMDGEVVLAHEGYDERFFILFEDYDLSLRLRMAGHRILSVEDALVLHRQGTPGISFRAQDYPRRRAFFHSRNRWLLMFKCHGAWTLLISMPGILVYELAWLLFTARAGHLGAHLGGKWAFLKLLPEAFRARRRVQAARKLSDGSLLVGGPLTLTPQIVAKPLAAALGGCLDRSLRVWWFLVRPLVR